MNSRAHKKRFHPVGKKARIGHAADKSNQIHKKMKKAGAATRGASRP